MNRSQLLAALLVGVAVVIVAVWRWNPGPSPEPEQLLSMGEIRALFDSAGGWIALPLPDSKYEAGAIIQVDREGAGGASIRFLSHLRECYPPDVLLPNVGALPSVTTSRRMGFGADLLANMPSVELGPEARRINAVGLQIDSLSTEAFDPLRIAIWEEEGTNYDLVPEACRSFLQQEGVYVIAEAARVNRATYSLYDTMRTRIRVDAENLRDFLNIRAGVDATVDSEGRVVITNPVTLAIRRARRTAGGFAVLGPGDSARMWGDALLDSILRGPGER